MARADGRASFLGIQFPNAITPDIRVAKIDDVREETRRGHAIDSQQQQEKKSKHDRAVRQSEQISVEEIAGAEEEVIQTALMNIIAPSKAKAALRTGIGGSRKSR